MHVTVATRSISRIVRFQRRHRLLMSSGEGEKSRIYKTTDGGETGRFNTRQSQRDFSRFHSLPLGNATASRSAIPSMGKFLLLTTTDGEHWNPLPSGDMPAALPGKALLPLATHVSCSRERRSFLAQADRPHAFSTPLTQDTPGPFPKHPSPTVTRRPESSPLLSGMEKR